jgi:bZIP transcription factor
VDPSIAEQCLKSSLETDMSAPFSLSSISMIRPGSALNHELKQSNSTQQSQVEFADMKGLLYSPDGMLGFKYMSDIPNDNEKLSRSRERNREHARKTRLRKKEQMQDLQSKAKQLSSEHQLLKQRVEECNIASILVGLSSNAASEEADKYIDTSFIDDVKANKVALLTDGRKRYKKMLIGSVMNPISNVSSFSDGGDDLSRSGNKASINWKTGSYYDGEGKKNLNAHQLENLR